MATPEEREEIAVRAFVRRHDALRAALEYRVNELADRSDEKKGLAPREAEELEFLTEALQGPLNAITAAWNDLMDALGRE